MLFDAEFIKAVYNIELRYLFGKQFFLGCAFSDGIIGRRKIKPFFRHIFEYQLICMEQLHAHSLFPQIFGHSRSPVFYISCQRISCACQMDSDLVSPSCKDAGFCQRKLEEIQVVFFLSYCIICKTY